MPQALQCENCGAVLIKQDLFCGECGAPRPSLPPTSEPGPVESLPAPSPSVEAPSPTARSSPATSWTIAALVLGLLGVILGVVGLAVFLLFGLTGSEVASPRENWIYSGFCCLLPIAGTGGILAVTALAIWLTRVRNR
jgi:hypothetical protein